MRLNLAIRNTFRHKRRTALNLLMIAGGVCAIILFEGFAHNLVIGLRETTIQTQSGHLQLATSAFWAKSAKTPKDALIVDYTKLVKEIKKDPHVRYAAGRLSLFGLLSHGEESLSARGISVDPKLEASRMESFHFISGRALDEKHPYQVALGSGLAKRMKVKPGDRLSLLGYTYDGTVNALDLEVSGVFRTAISDFDDSTFLMPFASAQKLLDTTGVEQIVIGLDSTDNTEAVLAALQTRLDPTAKVLRLKPWSKVAKLYHQVAAFNGIQNRIVEIIILSLILLSILNTVGMSIFERTGEIGTLRALGETGKNVLWQFVLEGAVLGVFGAALGVAFGLTGASLINSLKLSVVMPGASALLTIKIDFFLSAFRDAALLSVFCSMLAALVPAWRASRMNVADALRKNI